MYARTLQRILRTTLSLWLCLLPLFAQAAPWELTITSAAWYDGAGAIYFDAVNETGGAESGLLPGALMLTVGGAAAQIDLLRTLREAGEGIAVALLVDTSNAANRAALQRAVATWIDSIAKPDKLAVFTCGGEPLLIADFVSDPTLLTAAAGSIRFGGDDARLYDGLRMVAERIALRASTLPERVAVVLITDGTSEASVRTTAEDAVALLGARGAALYLVEIGDAGQAVRPLRAASAAIYGSSTPLETAVPALMSRIYDSYALFFSGAGTAVGVDDWVQLTALGAGGEALAQAEAPLTAAELPIAGIAQSIPLTPAPTALSASSRGAARSPEPTPTPRPTADDAFVITDTSATQLPEPTDAAVQPSAAEATATATATTNPPQTDAPVADTTPLPAGIAVFDENPTPAPGLLARAAGLIGLDGLARELPARWRALDTPWQALLLVLTFALLVALVMLFGSLRQRRRRRKQRRQITRMIAAERRPVPPTAQGGPPMQTNIAVRPPAYRPITGKPIGGDAGVAAAFQIIRPRGTVENRRATVSDGFTIGRDAACDLTIRDGSVLPRHAVLHTTEDGTLCVREDLHATVYAGGDRIRGFWPLESGSTLRLGKVSLTIRYPDGEARRVE